WYDRTSGITHPRVGSSRWESDSWRAGDHPPTRCASSSLATVRVVESHASARQPTCCAAGGLKRHDLTADPQRTQPTLGPTLRPRHRVNTRPALTGASPHD